MVLVRPLPLPLPLLLLQLLQRTLLLILQSVQLQYAVIAIALTNFATVRLPRGKGRGTKGKEEKRGVEEMLNLTVVFKSWLLCYIWPRVYCLCVYHCNAVPDKPIISDVVSGDSFIVVAWQVTSAVDANPGHTFFVRYRCSGAYLFQ